MKLRKGFGGDEWENIRATGDCGGDLGGEENRLECVEGMKRRAQGGK
jgi:hypothetical protein